MRSLIVTGATGGLGTEVVRHLRNDYSIVALYRSEENFVSLREMLGSDIRGVQADLADSASVRRAVRSIVPYGLVHLAGGFAAGSMDDTTDAVWTRMIDLNLRSAFVAIRETLGVMDHSTPGRIVVISSEATLAKAAGSVAYTVAKSALNVLIEVLAKELRGTPITANALLPSSLDTAATRAEMPGQKLIPLSRVAETIQFLLSESAAGISGALIPLTAR